MELSTALDRYQSDPGSLLVDTLPAVDQLCSFIRRFAPKAVLGLSGGVDSAVVAALAARALGPDHVHGLIMPAGNAVEDAEDALAVAEKLGIETTTIDLAPIADACIVASDLFSDQLAKGNLKARLRMAHLYALARREHSVVLGTGNRSELLIGYFTKYGDGGADILPIGHCYKTQVWELARRLELPPAVIDRPPSAGLWSGQTDEAEIGLDYPTLDRILLGYDLGMVAEGIAAETGLTLATVDDVFGKIARNEHKRRLAPAPSPIFAAIDDASASGPSRRRPVLTVDAIVKHDGKYVLITRGAPPFAGREALPGGHVEYGQTCEAAVLMEVRQETGLEFAIDGLLGVYSHPARDPRGHYISVVFYGRGRGALRAGSDARAAHLVAAGDMAPSRLAFDHSKIWEDYQRWVGA